MAYRTKLIANALDRASTACFVSGIFVPVAAAMIGQPIAVPTEAFFASFTLWMVCGAILHVEAQRVIATVRE
jgi:hypothetical protein